MHFRCCANHVSPDTQRTEFAPLITEKTKETEIRFSVLSVPSCFFNPQNMRPRRACDNLRLEHRNLTRKRGLTGVLLAHASGFQRLFCRILGSQRAPFCVDAWHRTFASLAPSRESSGALCLTQEARSSPSRIASGTGTGSFALLMGGKVTPAVAICQQRRRLSGAGAVFSGGNHRECKTLL